MAAVDSQVASHDKTVDTPQAHRGLKGVPEVAEEKPAQQQNFHIGDKHEHQEPQWQETQRWGCKAQDHNGMLAHQVSAGGAVRPASSRRDRRSFDHAENNDWTHSTSGSSVQKVVQTAGEQSPIRRPDEWSSSSNNKRVDEVSPKRDLDLRREPITIPNETKRTKAEAQELVTGWNTESMKTVPKEEKRELNLCPPAVAPSAPKPFQRPEDWDSNLKTLPNCARGAERKPHVYDRIEDSVVPQVRATKRTF